MRPLLAATTGRACAIEMAVKDHGMFSRPPPGEPVTGAFTPRQAGEVKLPAGWT
jgi:hypothetical protein